MKKIFVVIVLISLLTIACKDKNPTDEELFNELQKTINNIENYSCDVSMIIHGNKKPEKYLAKYFFLKPNKYKVQYMDGKQDIYFDGKKTFFIYPNIDKIKIIQNKKETKEDTSFFLGYFLERIQTSEEMQITSEDDYLIIKMNLPGNNTSRKEQKIWFSKENFKPLKMTIIDSEGKETIEIKYTNLNYDIKLTEKNLFESL
ncbi:LolA family protein [Senegalia sp. (in: firmicutes)]|uniref:LolA family protein n=1 Tax=Senegalia sp. (in: firmicutes) TaxID=1924098 RepID=UPI003F9A0D21